MDEQQQIVELLKTADRKVCLDAERLVGQVKARQVWRRRVTHRLLLVPCFFVLAGAGFWANSNWSDRDVDRIAGIQETVEKTETGELNQSAVSSSTDVSPALPAASVDPVIESTAANEFARISARLEMQENQLALFRAKRKIQQAARTLAELRSVRSQLNRSLIKEQASRHIELPELTSTY